MGSTYCRSCFKPFGNVSDMFNKTWCDECQNITDKAAEALREANPSASPTDILEAGRTARLQRAGHARLNYISPRDFNRADMKG
jgi:hypothetical protein